MKRQRVIDEVRHALGGTATANAASLALEAVLRAIRDGLNHDGQVKIADFGTFRVHEAAARAVRHPQTGALCTVPAHRAVKFKAAPQQRRLVPTPHTPSITEAPYDPPTLPL